MEENLNKKTILIVDDEKTIVDMLVYNLQKEGYNTLEANDGEEAVNIALSQKPNLVLLDIMLPKMDGLAVCKRIRQSLDIPILMISAKDEEIDKILGLELGADDYITKPFSVRELMARVKANLRKAELSGKSSSSATTDNKLEENESNVNKNQTEHLPTTSLPKTGRNLVSEIVIGVAIVVLIIIGGIMWKKSR